ncbi:MAG: rubrerythrin [Chlamydiota bacterium]
MELKNSKTAENLQIAFAGESQARNRYTYFASVAKKEGYVQISKVFEETASHEKEHAKRLFKFMTGGETQIEAAYPFGTIGTTLENLKAAAGGENHEHTSMYPEFAKIAREEGFDVIADVFESIAIAERQHEKRYLGLAKNIEGNTVFQKEDQQSWYCLNCGYRHEGQQAPQACPACKHPRAYFELLKENW